MGPIAATRPPTPDLSRKRIVISEPHLHSLACAVSTSILPLPLTLGMPSALRVPPGVSQYSRPASGRTYPPCYRVDYDVDASYKLVKIIMWTAQGTCKFPVFYSNLENCLMTLFTQKQVSQIFVNFVDIFSKHFN